MEKTGRTTYSPYRPRICERIDAKAVANTQQSARRKSARGNRRLRGGRISRRMTPGSATS